MAEGRAWVAALLTTLVMILLFSQVVLILSPQERAITAFKSNKRLNYTLVNQKPKYTPNPAFIQKHKKPEKFAMEDSKKLLNMTNSILSIPTLLGYPEKEGRKMFPYQRYPSCQRRNPPPRGLVKLDYKRGLLLMKCPGSFKGKYVLGPIKGKRFTDNVRLMGKWHVRLYRGPVKLKKEYDFVIASCIKDSRRFELFQHIPRFDPKIKKRAVDITRKIRAQTKVTKKPMVIAMITIDSFSRNHFFRKLHKTVRYLNKLEKKQTWKVTDFKLHNIIGPDTVENQAELFANGYHGYDPEKIGKDQVGPSALWSRLAKKGFVSLFGVEACAYKMYYWVGNNPTADHISNPFFCANYRFTGYRAEKKTGRQQRCIGPHMSHYYLMNYTLDFLDQYEGTNRWAYNHITAAHEQSGQHAQTLDKDLVWYLKQLVGKFSKQNDLIIFLIADHGMRYGNFKTGKYAIQEHRLPAFFLLSKRSFLDKMEYSYDTLHHNTFRLTSKPDLRRTMLHLANYTLGLPLSNRTNPRAVSLFSEKVPNSRRCEDIGIPPWYCAAYVLNTIETRIFDPSNPKSKSNSLSERQLGRSLKDISNAIIYQLNARVYTVPSLGKGYLCKKLTFKKIVMASYSALSNGDILFKLTLQMTQIPKGWFETFVMISDRPEDIPVVGQETYQTFPVRYGGKKLTARIVMINRSDKYGGVCEEVARYYQVNPEHCACREEVVKQYLSHKKRKQ